MPKKQSGMKVGKKRKSKPDSRESGECTLANYSLELYITGMTPRSLVAVENIKNICGEYLYNRCKLKIIDIYQQPAMAKLQQIIAAPTLIKRTPLPVRRLIGDMSNTDRVLAGLDLRP